MSDLRLNKIEDALVKMADAVTELTKTESARVEREKVQSGINNKILKFMEKVEDEYKPTINISKKIHSFLFNFFTKYIATGIGLALLAAAGYNFV